MEHTRKKFTDIPEIDMKIIEGVPWAKKTCTILEDGLHKTFLYWCQIVLNIGAKDEILNEWVNDFIDVYEETCCDLIRNIEYLHGNFVHKLEELLQKVQQYCKTLQIPMPVCGKEQLSLYQEQYQLEKRIEEYEKIIKARVGELNKLRKKQSELCSSLGREPIILKDSPLPSAQEIEEFQKHIEKLESEKFSRLEKFISTKEELLKILKELNMQPSSSFEREVFSSDDAAFVVSDENMKKLEWLQESLHKKLKDVKGEIGVLHNKIDSLWNLLDVDLKERESFREKNMENSVDVVEVLRLEVKRCEELKKANMKEFIIKIRGELEEIWDKCHCSDSEKKNFGFFYTDYYNEDLLELHEVEKSKWKKYYEENKELLSLLEQHKSLWKKMIELETNTTGPNRYNNRGGQLLREEKERNRLAKKIPQIEETLNKLATTFQQCNGHPFTTFGETVQDYIIKLHNDRDSARKQKLSARKLYKEQTKSTPAKSAVSLFASASQLRSATPLTSTKRKLANPVVDDKKKAMTVQSEIKTSKTKKLPQNVPDVKVTNASAMSKRSSAERKKRIQKIRRLSAQKSKSSQAGSTSTSYETFRASLSNKPDARSSLISSETLSAATITIQGTTPKKI